MEINYTPLDINRLEEKPSVTNQDDFNYNTILLFIATLTVFVIAALLFVLIWKKTESQNIRTTETTQQGSSPDTSSPDIQISPVGSPGEAAPSPAVIPQK